jgi:hypothetical protein
MAADASYGNKLDPYRQTLTKGHKGDRQYVIVPNIPTTSAVPGQLVIVNAPDLERDVVITPGKMFISFNITLTSTTDTARSIVYNLGKAIVKQFIVKLGGREVINVSAWDCLACYRDLWLSTTERANMSKFGLSPTVNTNNIRVGSSAANNTVQPDASIARVYGNKFYIPLDFELLTTQMPHYNTGLVDKLSFELTFNDAGRVIVSTDTNATYTVSNLSLEYEYVKNPGLALAVHNRYMSGYSLLYNRPLMFMMRQVFQSDTVWNFNINSPAKSLKGLLLLFDNSTNYARNVESWFNPQITNVTVTIEGVPNQLYAQGLQPFAMWDEAARLMSRESSKDFDLTSINEGSFTQNMFALALDFRSTEDNTLHGSGRKIADGQQGITLQIQKTATMTGTNAGPMNCYIFMIMDAKLFISGGMFKENIW